MRRRRSVRRGIFEGAEGEACLAPYIRQTEGGETPPLQFASQIAVAALDEGGHFAVGDRAFVHPEAAVGMDPGDAAGADVLRGGFDSFGDEVGGFDGVDLDVYDAEADGDAGV